MTIEEKTAIMAEALQKQKIMKQSCTKEKKVNMPGFTDFRRRPSYAHRSA